MSSLSPSVPSIADVDRELEKAHTEKYRDLHALLIAAQSAAAGAQRLGDFERYALALNHQAWAHTHSNAYESALSCASEALVLARNNGLTEVEANAVNNIGLNFAYCGINHEAIQLFQYQFGLGQQLGNEQIMAVALSNEAFIHCQAKDFPTAIEMYGRAIALLPKSPENRSEAFIMHINMTITLLDGQAFEDAQTEAHKALEIAQQIKSSGFIAQASVLLGGAYIRRGKAEEAAKYVKMAQDQMPLIKMKGVHAVHGNIARVQGLIYEREGNDRKAAEAWEQAYQYAVLDNHVKAARDLLDYLKDVYSRIGDIGGLESIYNRSMSDIPRIQGRAQSMRFHILQTIFARDKSALQNEQGQLNLQKNELLDRISHEFRTPLTVIQLSTEMLENYGDKMPLQRRQDHLKGITNQVQWMTGLLENITGLLSDSTIEIVPFTLDALGAAAIDRLGKGALPYDRVQVDYPSGHLSVNAAFDLLAAILYHLLSNGLRYSESIVRLEISATEESLTLRITDTGIGIPEAEQKKIFTALVRGSNQTNATGGGLGLSIVAKLVDQLHGAINLKSGEHQGTTVTVSIPL